MQAQPSERLPASVPETLERRLLAGFGVVLAVFAVIVAQAVRHSLQSIESSDWVNHTHAVILEADGIVSSLNAAEAAYRAFLITGTARDQAAYRAAYAEMLEHLEVGKSLTAGDARQQTLFKSLEPLLQRRLDAARASIQARQERGSDAARQLLEADSGAVELRNVQQAVSQLKQEENQLLQRHDQASREQARWMRWLLFTGLGLDLLLLGFLFWLVRADLAVRRAAALALKNQNELLEVKVRERTAELASSIESLEIENLERRWAHEAIERLYRHSEETVRAVDQGVFVISRRGTVLRVNPAVVRLTGWESKDLIGQPLARFVRPAGAVSGATPWESDPLNAAMKEGRELQRLPAVVAHKDGRNITVRYSSQPVRDQDRVVGAIVTCLEIAA
ncbi:MAG: CHASE3 domain-containing protein [Verrucomicrobia bacterium]|nr:CHASE3 domain-containing protein [Verrucomicrobiota bacterium]